MKKILTLIIFFVIFLLTPSNVFANKNFSTDFDVIYTVSENTMAHIEYHGTITNNISKSFASRYKMQLGFQKIKNLKTTDSGGQITPQLIKNSNGTQLIFDFNKNTVGEGKKFIFNFSFDTDEVAENNGNIWEINIPGLSKNNDFTSFNTILFLPDHLNNPSYIKPDIPDFSNNHLENKYIFTKEQIGTSGISIAFGSYQIYSYEFIYNLVNKNFFPIKAQIALPPTTNYQDVVIDSIAPKPNNVQMDKDGNWIADFNLSRSQKINVSVKGKARIFTNPKEEFLSKEDRAEYLSEKPYWQISDPEIVDLAGKLKTPREIYKYVVKNLKYDFSRVSESKPRVGAAKVLDNLNSAVCLEFTDLFIALARAAGIPAREIDGYAYTKNASSRPISINSDILHAWPEYYDDKRKAWIMVDPTWENTTGGTDFFNILDFDHFAFVIKGKSSILPIPVGGYKSGQNNNTDDLIIYPSNNFKETKILNTELNIRDKNYSLIPIKGIVKIENTGNSISEPILLKYSSKSLQFISGPESLEKIPPFGSKVVSFTFVSSGLFTKQDDIITIRLGNEKVSKKISVDTFFYNFWLMIGGVIFVSFCIAVSFIAARSWRISISGRK